MQFCNPFSGLIQSLSAFCYSAFQFDVGYGVPETFLSAPYCPCSVCVSSADSPSETPTTTAGYFSPLPVASSSVCACCIHLITSVKFPAGFSYIRVPISRESNRIQTGHNFLELTSVWQEKETARGIKSHRSNKHLWTLWMLYSKFNEEDMLNGGIWQMLFGWWFIKTYKRTHGYNDCYSNYAA